MYNPAAIYVSVSMSSFLFPQIPGELCPSARESTTAVWREYNKVLERLRGFGLVGEPPSSTYGTQVIFIYTVNIQQRHVEQVVASAERFFTLRSQQSEIIQLLHRSVGNYRTELYDTQRDEYLPTPQDHRIHVLVKDPDDQVVLSRPLPSEGTFRFTSHTSGEHQICLQPDSSQPAGGLLTVHLDIRVGEGTYSYSELAVKDKQTQLALRVRQLIEQYKEEHFRLTNYNTNMWIFWWPVIRSLYVVLFIIWHTKSW
ncbi:hypothetical protein ABVT39_018630 [Epinephelus coioides]